MIEYEEKLMGRAINKLGLGRNPGPFLIRTL